MFKEVILFFFEEEEEEDIKEFLYRKQDRKNRKHG